MTEPARSAVPVAAAGIICLGLVPTLGGPDLPLHWAMTAGMTGFGLLLLVRRRLQRREAPLALVEPSAVRQAARAFFITVGVIGALIAGLLAVRMNPHSPTTALSLALPALGLGWLGLIGLRVLRHRPAPAPAEASTKGVRLDRAIQAE
ncbi:MAG TPA: hypothetical protein VHB79_11175 [Polyangiaceae bacterium]|nr:hypothetical protein [Polyangiaceae bacterium]